MNNPIIIAGLADIAPTADQAAIALRDSLLAGAGDIVRVDDGFDYDVAVGHAKKIKEFLKFVEDGRAAAKRPVTDLANQIQEFAKTLTGDLDAERNRIGKLIVAFEDAERRKREAAEQAAREEAEKIAREAAEQQAERVRQEHAEGRTGTLMPDLENIQDEAAKKLADVKQNLANTVTPKAKGLRRTTALKFEVVDVKALFAARPDLFSPDDVKIRDALKITRDIPGLKVTEEVKV